MFFKEMMKKIVFRYTNFGTPKYNYCIEPIQLAKIITSIEEVQDVAGNILEIGVARGMTSRFIAEHLMLQKQKTNFYCIDTFESFTDNDMNFEVNNRNKELSEFRAFNYNDYNVWKKNFSEFKFVKPIKADINIFDFNSVAPIKFVFLDVDLYLPTINALRNMFPHLTNGAIIVLDDIQNNTSWDGAYQALNEFVKEKNLNYEIHGNKCGLIRL